MKGVQIFRCQNKDLSFGAWLCSSNISCIWVKVGVGTEFTALLTSGASPSGLFRSALYLDGFGFETRSFRLHA